MDFVPIAMGFFLVDNGTEREQIKNIKRQETDMTEILRDVAAFASLAMFVGSMSLIMLAL